MPLSLYTLPKWQQYNHIHNMYPTPNKYDKIYVKSRNPYKTKNTVEKIIDDTYEQLRIHYKCESEYFKKLGYK